MSLSSIPSVLPLCVKGGRHSSFVLRVKGLGLLNTNVFLGSTHNFSLAAPVNDGRFPPLPFDPLTKSVSYLPKQFVPLSFHSTLDDETSSYFHLQAITKHKMISLLLLQQLLGCPTESLAFASTRSSPLAARSNANNVLERQSIGPLSMAGGEGGEAEWVKGTI